MKEKKRNQNRILLYTVLISLLLHGLIMFVPIQLSRDAREEPMRVVRINPVEIPHEQIVDEIEKSTNNEAPENTRFLSKNNKKVEQETKARNVGPTKNQNSVPPALNPDNQSA